MDRAPGRAPEVWRQRAAAVLEEITGAGRFDGGRGLFGTRRPLRGRTYEHLWPFACAWSAAETAAGLGGEVGDRAGAVAAAALRGLDAYRTTAAAPAPSRDPRAALAQLSRNAAGTVGFESSVTAPLGRGGEVYYDDNAWVALALLERHRRTRDEACLELACRVVAFCCTGWSAEEAWARPGGIRWKVPRANRSRNTCANGPLSEAATLVHAATGDPGALEWAVRIYDWVRGALLGPDGLYLDRITPDGTRAPDRWTYNQGTMVGAAVLLAGATGSGRYVDDARVTADAALARFDAEALLAAGSAAFHAIFLRNLLLLDARVPDPRIAALAEDYGERTWWQVVRARRRSSLPGARRDGLNTLAPLLEIYALLAGAPAHP